MSLLSPTIPVVFHQFLAAASTTVNDTSGPGWAASIVMSLSLGIGGAVTVWVGRRQAAGTLKRNDLAGYRTKATMKSDAAWQAAHDSTANLTTWAGIVMLVGGILLLANPTGALWVATVVIPLVVGMGLVILGGVKAQRAANAVNASALDSHGE